MDPAENPKYRSLEDRIQKARAEQSIAIGYAIGDALAAMWRVLSSLPFSPSVTPLQKESRWRSLIARFPMHR